MYAKIYIYIYIYIYIHTYIYILIFSVFLWYLVDGFHNVVLIKLSWDDDDDVDDDDDDDDDPQTRAEVWKVCYCAGFDFDNGAADGGEPWRVFSFFFHWEKLWMIYIYIYYNYNYQL